MECRDLKLIDINIFVDILNAIRAGSIGGEEVFHERQFENCFAGFPDTSTPRQASDVTGEEYVCAKLILCRPLVLLILVPQTLSSDPSVSRDALVLFLFSPPTSFICQPISLITSSALSKPYIR